MSEALALEARPSSSKSVSPLVPQVISCFEEVKEVIKVDPALVLVTVISLRCEKVRAEDEKGLPHVWIAGLDHKFGSQTTLGVGKTQFCSSTQLKNDTVFLQVFWSLLGTGCRLVVGWL
jgi:hypothetical protein